MPGGLHAGLCRAFPELWLLREGVKESLKAPPGWFVGMMCVISFLLFIVALVCIVKRRRGQQYPVDEKELQLGRDAADQPRDHLPSFGEYARRYSQRR